MSMMISTRIIHEALQSLKGLQMMRRLYKIVYKFLLQFTGKNEVADN